MKIGNLETLLYVNSKLITLSNNPLKYLLYILTHSNALQLVLVDVLLSY